MFSRDGASNLAYSLIVRLDGLRLTLWVYQRLDKEPAVGIKRLRMSFCLIEIELFVYHGIHRLQLHQYTIGIISSLICC